MSMDTNLNAVRDLKPLDEPPGEPTHETALTPGQLALLAAIQDRLIPREGDLPGAGESGAAQRVNTYLAQRPDWRAEVLAALRAVDVAAHQVWTLRPESEHEPARSFLGLTGDEQDAALQGTEAAEPRLFARLLRVTYSAYYADPEVRRQAGFEAQPPQPGGYGLEPFDPSRLEPIRRRGRLWREA